MKSKAVQSFWLLVTLAATLTTLAASRPRPQVCVDCNPVPNALSSDICLKGVSR